MLFFLLILFILILIFSILTILMLSTIKIEIKDFIYDNLKVNDLFKIKFSINLFNKIKLFWFTLDKKKIEKIWASSKNRKFDIKKFKGKVKLNKDTLKALTKIKINIEKLKLKINLGIEDAPTTSYIVAVISSILGIILPKVSKKLSNCKYTITPIYNGKNQVKIELNSITSIKIVHIIYVIYILSMKGRDENNERTSNRRSYGYSYGQY